MAGCCSRQGYDEFFTEKIALRDARTYRRRGLDANGRRLVSFFARRGVQGATVLDVGGGNGTIGLELLKAGAERAITVELSSSYDETAAQLAREAGFEDRVERRVVDFAEAGQFPDADVVVMHRVVCCYPDGPGLVAAAAERTRRLLGFTHPRRAWWTRLGATAVNAVLTARRMEYRTFIHRPAALIQSAEQSGTKLAHEHEATLWRVLGFERPA